MVLESHSCMYYSVGLKKVEISNGPKGLTTDIGSLKEIL